MNTRMDYLNGKCTHREYYSQLVTSSIINAVKDRLTKKRIKDSLQEDEHLNNIPLKEWDMMAIYLCQQSANVRAKLRALGDVYSNAGGVCILKEAARQIAEEK